jgi:hypothetical protein
VSGLAWLLKHKTEKVFVLPREDKVTTDDIKDGLGDQSHPAPSALEGALSAPRFPRSKTNVRN